LRIIRAEITLTADNRVLRRLPGALLQMDTRTVQFNSVQPTVISVATGILMEIEISAVVDKVHSTTDKCIDRIHDTTQIVIMKIAGDSRKIIILELKPQVIVSIGIAQRIKTINGRNGARNLAREIAPGKICTNHKITTTVKVSTQEVAGRDLWGSEAFSFDNADSDNLGFESNSKSFGANTNSFGSNTNSFGGDDLEQQFGQIQNKFSSDDTMRSNNGMMSTRRTPISRNSIGTSQSGNHAYCRSKSAEDRPFCIDESGKEQICMQIKQCPRPALPDYQVNDTLRQHETNMRIDVKYRQKAIEIANSYTDVAVYFEPRYQSCGSIDLYQSFVAHVVGNQKVIELLESCDNQRDENGENSMQYPNYVPYILKWVLHFWNICCFALIYLMLAKMIIQPIDKKIGNSLTRSHVKPQGDYKMDGYLTST